MQPVRRPFASVAGNLAAELRSLEVRLPWDFMLMATVVRRFACARGMSGHVRSSRFDVNSFCPMTHPVHGPMTHPVHGPMTHPVHGPMTHPVHGPMTHPVPLPGTRSHCQRSLAVHDTSLNPVRRQRCRRPWFAFSPSRLQATLARGNLTTRQGPDSALSNTAGWHQGAVDATAVDAASPPPWVTPSSATATAAAAPGWQATRPVECGSLLLPPTAPLPFAQPGLGLSRPTADTEAVRASVSPVLTPQASPHLHQPTKEPP